MRCESDRQNQHEDVAGRHQEMAASASQPVVRRSSVRSTIAAWIAIGFASATNLPRHAMAQDASLAVSAVTTQQTGLTLENCCFLYRKLPPEAEYRELQINDIITVLVDYRASMLSEGDADNRKTANLNAALTDWLGFDGKSLFNAPQRRGDLRINGQLRSQYRAEAEMELRDSLTFRIAAKVVDIRPNGNLVIEAHRTIRINEEVWEQSLTGIVRRQSIGPNRTVRSDEVAELRVDKREIGFVRDGYARGWFTRWYDHWKPF